MLLNYFFVCTGFYGIVNLTVLTIYFKNNKIINLHSLLMLFFLSLNFIIISLNQIFPQLNILLDSPIYNYLFVFDSTLLYLYIKNIEDEVKYISKRNFKHLIIIFIIVLCASYFYTTSINLDVFKIILVIISLYYYYKIFSLLKKRIYNDQSKIKLLSAENEIINKVTVFIFLLSLIYLIQMIMVFDFYHEKKLNDLISNCFGAVIFNVALIKISSSQEILFGYKLKNNIVHTIKNLNLKYSELWIKVPLKKITNSQDLILSENIKDNLQTYSNKIDTLIIDSKILRKSNISIEEIAIMLEIPKSHLTFLFKYHCKINYSEYKKAARVYDSFQLIKNGFLKTNTLEALSLKVGFSSYNPFYMEFKKITGTTPQLYSKNYI